MYQQNMQSRREVGTETTTTEVRQQGTDTSHTADALEHQEEPDEQTGNGQQHRQAASRGDEEKASERDDAEDNKSST